jgi:isoquinoline 1-oxidoreductase beta subunit
MQDESTSTLAQVTEHPVGRRQFVGYAVAAATVVGAAQFGTEFLTPAAAAPIPAVPEPSDLYDLTDLLTDAADPTSGLISVVMHTDGTANFQLPRAEVGQGITTSMAMLIAEELDLPLSKVNVTLAPARPELIWNQITGGSNSIHAMFTPVRIAAAVARQSLLTAAAAKLATPLSSLSVMNGVVTAPDGSSVTYGALASIAATTVNKAVGITLKPYADFTLIGTPQRRKDALDAVTGRKQYAMDLQIPGALPAMVCRPPQLNGTPGSITNLAAVKAMPGVTHVVAIPTGVAVRAHTFGQCIDAVRALQVVWNNGPEPTASDASVLAELRGAQRPMATPNAQNLVATAGGVLNAAGQTVTSVTSGLSGLTGALGLGGIGSATTTVGGVTGTVSSLASQVHTLDTDFTFYFRSGSPLETNSAVADVQATHATIWASSKTPIAAAENIAVELGLPVGSVTFNVVEGGGSFGRKLFWDAAREAALISKACAAPVRLMWHRADEPRQGRNHPMATSRIRTTWLGDSILSLEQQHTSVSTDFRHGFGELLTSMEASLPSGLGNLGDSELIFTLSQQLGYNFGATTQGLDEIDGNFNTSSVRNIYSPDVRCALELTVDQVAAKMGLDPVAFRLKYAKDDRLKRVINQVAAAGNWGRTMAPGTAQGIAIHQEYKGFSACLVEIDCRPAQTGRVIPNGVGGPRVTKVTFAIDCGLVVNPMGVEAQMQGGINDGIALALTASSHLDSGHFLEASWDNYFYTRQWNTPYDVKVFVMEPTNDVPGGVGEAGVAASFAAVAAAYTRATGTMPTSFPINHNGPLGFEVKSFVPPVPASPTDGLSTTF